METLYYPAEQKSAPKDLLVMLPGIGDYHDIFERKAIIEELRAKELPLDVIAVNAHYRYYSERTVLDRLKDDVVDPAYEHGYERVHFMGISLGGYGILLYMREHPGDISSAILLAPYLGEPEHYAHLLEDGASEVYQGEENIWPWLEELPESTLRKIHLGYGEADNYVESHRLLSAYLPEEQTMAVSGDHTWSTWQQLWSRLLAQVRLPGGSDSETAVEYSARTD